MRRITVLTAAGAIVTCGLATQPAAAQLPVGPVIQQPAEMSLHVRGAGGGDVRVGRRVKVIGTVRPFVPNQRVDVRLERSGNTIRRFENAQINQVGTEDKGRFVMRSPRLIKPGRHRAFAQKPETPEQQGASAESKDFKIHYPNLGRGEGGREVAIFNDLLDRQGFYTSEGRKYNDRTARAVMAFRKTNRMSRRWGATSGIFRKLADGRGEFNLAYPGRGHHVEVDISRQVMVLADNGKAKHTFHISSGAPATPSDKGNFTFYRKDPGFNSIGMYYSVYYNRGEATHGYKSVPTYPASHGCIRNPIPDSKFIYNWINLGNSMSVYR